VTDTNPILVGGFRIPFDRIEAKHVRPGVEQALTDAQAAIDALSADPSPPTWGNTLAALDSTVERLGERIAPVTHLMSVAETPALREAYNVVLPTISAFWSRLPLNEALWRRVKAFAATEEAQGLTGIRRRHLDKTVRDFERAGADLPPQAKARLDQVRIELAQLQQTFSENVLDETAAFELVVTDEKRLAGVPEAPKRRARERAKKRKKKGWLLTLDYPSVEPILKYCTDRGLRKEIMVGYATR
jgi:oligopeptidase A